MKKTQGKWSKTEYLYVIILYFKLCFCQFFLYKNPKWSVSKLGTYCPFCPIYHNVWTKAPHGGDGQHKKCE